MSPFEFCPGSSKFKQPEPEIVKCLSCGKEMEIWTDEVQASCPSCKNVFIRQDSKASCLEWCKHAKDCVGKETYDKFIHGKAVTLRDKLIKRLEDYFSADVKRINHAKQVTDYASELLLREKGDWHIVIAASILHDVGIKVAEEKYGSNAGHLQEKEGPEIAGKILTEEGFEKKDIEEICQIVGCHHSPGKLDTENFKIVYDADWLVNLKDEVNIRDKVKLRQVIEKVFLTETGKVLAEKIYL